MDIQQWYQTRYHLMITRCHLAYLVDIVQISLVRKTLSPTKTGQINPKLRRIKPAWQVNFVHFSPKSRKCLAQIFGIAIGIYVLVDPSIYTVSSPIREECYRACHCAFRKILLCRLLRNWVFMPLLDLYDIDFHV